MAVFPHPVGDLQDRSEVTESERLRVTLARGVLLFRWAMVAFMTAIAATGEPFRRPVLAWISIAVAAAWTTVLTVRGHRWQTSYMLVDFAVCAWLLIASGVVVPVESVVSGRPFFAQGYPVSAAVMWGVARGPGSGLAAGAALSLFLIAVRPLNGVPLDELEARQVATLAGAVLNYIVAAGAVGLVARLLVESAEAVDAANRAAVVERERAARLAERERIGRQIHDSVLQVLALIHKRGRELTRVRQIPPAKVAELADLAGAQEVELRGLILREPEESPTGSASLRAALEQTARAVEGIAVTVSSVGPVWLDRACVEEIAAATRQALDNVVEHAAAGSATVFAEEEDGVVSITVRDDGRGFAYDEDHLRATGKAGMLKSMKGRIEDLGGTMSVSSAPGRGTEIEFRLETEPHRTQEPA
ncbi:MAG TPA: ATP-binding protein [Actinomycetota bacterium]|nr:ATP-binding protein [Actinomycetota bacterium]